MSAEGREAEGTGEGGGGQGTGNEQADRLAVEATITSGLRLARSGVEELETL